jgi:esterase FrsA
MASPRERRSIGSGAVGGSRLNRSGLAIAPALCAALATVLIVVTFPTGAAGQDGGDFRREDFNVEAGGRRFVASVLSPVEGKLAKDPALLLTFAGERGMSLLKEPYCKAAKAFLRGGHRAASFDLPGHGDRVDPRFGKSIASFKNALVAGTDVFANVAEDGRAVIGEYIQRGLAKPGRIAVAGTSRGGYMALRVLAGDERVAAGAGFAPVTDWRMLTEFAAARERADVAELRLAQFAGRMAGRGVYLAIGKTDDRVGTAACRELHRALVAANETTGRGASLVEFNLTDDAGHSMGAEGYERGAAFLLKQLERKDHR